jgi:hypothetical protein
MKALQGYGIEQSSALHAADGLSPTENHRVDVRIGMSIW